MTKTTILALTVAVCLSGSAALHAQKTEAQQVEVTLTGGHDTDPRDHGRPDVLIAAALGVPTEVFREAFSHVTPAAGGREPDPEQVRRNKHALLQALGPYGITNDRIDEVSNYYRYSRSRGEELWRTTPATAYATVRDGVITGFTITNPGSGYSSAPIVSIAGMPGVKISAKLTFGADFSRNGSITLLSVSPEK